MSKPSLDIIVKNCQQHIKVNFIKPKNNIHLLTPISKNTRYTKENYHSMKQPSPYRYRVYIHK